MQKSSGVKFRCRPTAEQINILNQWIGHQRFIYNAKVAEDKYFLAFKKQSLSLTGEPLPSDQQYSQFKDEELTPFLYEVPSQVLRNGSYRYMQAQVRFRKGLAGRPAMRKKHGRQTVMLTRELFRFEPVNQGQHRLFLGTDKFPLGEIKFKAHRPYEIPNTITISRHNNEWHVSFNYATEGDTHRLSEQELIDYFSSLSREELEKITIGGDRGVVIPLATSDGTAHDFTEREKQGLASAEQRRGRYQKRMARQVEGSNRRNRTKAKIDKTYTSQRNTRQDRAHKISHGLVNTEAKVFVFEDLKVKNMTRRASPKKDDTGRYVRNGASAKSGLNKAILRSIWGQIVMFAKYKALHLEKLTISIPASGTSQECSECGHTHPDNRETQSLFACKSCGFTANADDNASLVIKKRGIEALLGGGIIVKQKKTIKFTSSTRVGTPGVMRVSMDCSTVGGSARESALAVQEAIVRRSAGPCLPVAGAGESRSSHLKHVNA
jgi:putative transposase